jgi:hypothetical protein
MPAPRRVQEIFPLEIQVIYYKEIQCQIWFLEVKKAFHLPHHQSLVYTGKLTHQ